MGKSCGWPLEMCLGEQYYDLGHPTKDIVPFPSKPDGFNPVH